MACGKEIKQTSKSTHNYEYKALALSKQVRELKRDNQYLRSEMAKITAEKEHLQMAMNSKGGKSSRSIASIPQKKAEDLVNFDLYKWSPEKLLGVGEKALHFKKYDKSAQFYNTLMKEYPGHESINDKVLFEAGLAAYESKVHYDWAADHFARLVKKYPKSKWYRGAEALAGPFAFSQGRT